MRSQNSELFRGKAFVGRERRAVTSPTATMQGQITLTTEEAAPNNLKDAVFWNRLILRPLGLWPLDQDASELKHRTKLIAFVFSIYFISLYMIPQYLYITFSNPGRDALLGIISPQLFDLLAVTKFIVMATHSDKIGFCLRCIKSDWSEVNLESDRKTMRKNAKFGNDMTVCSVGFMYSGILFYYVTLPFLNTNLMTTAKSNGTATEKLLPHPINYVFLDEQSSPTYEISWVLQFIGSSYMCMLNCGCYGLIASLVAHACGQLQILSSRLENLADGSREQYPGAKDRLTDVIDRHSRVIRYTEYLNKSFRVIFLVDNVGGLSATCFLGYLAIANWNRNKSLLSVSIIGFVIIAFVFNLFVISFVGQRLWNESQEFAIATNRVTWYSLSTKIARSYTMCIVLANRPLKLTAFNVLDLSLETFGQVLKGSMVFLNMVREVTGSI